MATQRGNGTAGPVSESHGWDYLVRSDAAAARMISIDDAGCWLWTGAGSGRYGQLMRNSVNLYAHRYTYELLVGPIPPGLQIDHLCRVTSCVNPAHLEAVTPLENTRRSRGNVSKTHCPQGHPYSGDNLGRWRGRRYCRTCRIACCRAWRAARKAAS
jgi:hypothetical protein